MHWWVVVVWIDQVLKEGIRRVDEVEIFYAEGVEVSADLKRTNVNIATRSDECGLGIRTIDKGRIGSSSTHNPKMWRECLDAAIASGKLTTPQEWNGLPKELFREHEKICYDSNLTVDPQTASDLLEGMLDGASQYSAEITSGTATLSTATEMIVNSNDMRCTKQHTGVSISLEAIKGQSTGSEFAQSCFFDVDPYFVGERAAFLAFHSADGKEIETGEYDVLLSPIAYAELLGTTFIPALNGRNVHAGRSYLANHLGELIVDKNLVMYDDPFKEKGLGSTHWDAEGMPTSRIDFVKEGVLSSFAYDLRTAYRYGMESTASAIRSGPNGGTAIGHHNFIVDGPRTDVTDERVIYINSVVGAHTVNPMSGDFSVELSNAFWMENGEFQTPIHSAMFAGNVFTMLKNICGVSKDVRQVGSLILPSIKLQKQHLIGK